MWLRFDATTLWHSDAAEWAPSTASNAAYLIRAQTGLCPCSSDSDLGAATQGMQRWPFASFAATQEERPPTAAVSPNQIMYFDYAVRAAAIRFLRQPSRPNAPRPEAKSGRVAGRGVVPSPVCPPIPNVQL